MKTDPSSSRLAIKESRTKPEFDYSSSSGNFEREHDQSMNLGSTSSATEKRQTEKDDKVDSTTKHDQTMNLASTSSEKRQTEKDDKEKSITEHVQTMNLGSTSSATEKRQTEKGDKEESITERVPSSDQNMTLGSNYYQEESITSWRSDLVRSVMYGVAFRKVLRGEQLSTNDKAILHWDFSYVAFIEYPTATPSLYPRLWSPHEQQQVFYRNTASWTLESPTQLMEVSPNYTFNPRPVFLLAPNSLHTTATPVRCRSYPYIRPEDNHENLPMPHLRIDQLDTLVSATGQPMSVAVIPVRFNPPQDTVLFLDHALVRGAAVQSQSPSSSATVSVLVINEESKKIASYASIVSGLSDSSSSAINEPSKKADSSSKIGERSGTVKINRENVTQNPMVVTRATSSTLSANARPWSPRNKIQQRPPMANQMETVTQNPMVVTRATSSTLSPNARPWSPRNTTQQRPPAFAKQNYVNHQQQVSGMHQLNLNASTPVMYEPQDQMGIVPCQAPMMQNHHFVRPPVRPTMQNQQQFMRPETNQRMPMMSPSGQFGFDPNCFNPLVQQNLGFPIDTTHGYNLRHQHMQQFPPPQMQQPTTQSQGINARPSSHQGQDKNQQ